ADLLAAFEAAEKNPVIATVGIRPTFPATGYGYIQAREEENSETALSVQRFVEKPDRETAQSYLDQGDYFWNGGIFVWRPGTILDSIERHCPALHSSFATIRSSLAEGEDLTEILPREYPQLEKISIDYAVMEKADNVVMIRSTFDWDDVGSWPAVARHYPQDEKANILKGNIVTEDSTHNLVISEGEHLVGLIGVEDLMVIHTEDATLVCPKDRAEDVKKLVKKIEAHNGGKQYL
ncbi:MAG: mannose-1-phosphate guanylyltransferase, partial [Puniceicoccales bacterium]